MSDFMKTRTKKDGKVKDRFDIYVKMEGTIDGKLNMLEYKASGSDANEFVEALFTWIKNHSKDIMKFYGFKRGLNDD